MNLIPIYRIVINDLPRIAEKLHIHASIIERHYTDYSTVVSRYNVNGKKVVVCQRHLQDNATEFLNLYEKIVEWRQP